MHAVRRECRGLLLDARSGVVLARRFHKFFNINERPETEELRVADLMRRAGEDNGGSVPFEVLEKVDGTLCSPLLLPSPDGGKHVRWATRSVLSEEVESFAAATAGYNGLADWCGQV